jgi:hypothetical protein
MSIQDRNDSKTECSTTSSTDARGLSQPVEESTGEETRDNAASASESELSDCDGMEVDEDVSEMSFLVDRLSIDGRSQKAFLSYII